MTTLTSLRQVMFYAPCEWYGQTDDGCAVYIRYRHGYLSMGISHVGGTIDDAMEDDERFDAIRIGSETQSCLDQEEMLEALGLICPQK